MQRGGMVAVTCKYPGTGWKRQQRREVGGGFVVVAPMKVAMIHYHTIMRSREKGSSTQR
jgi:hypothetical protein